MTELVTLNESGNFAAMAAAMGMSADLKKEKTKTATLARLKIDHSGVMGEENVKGKVRKVQVVDGGMYVLQRNEQENVYCQEPTIRLFNQRFMYKRYVKGAAGQKDRYVKTIMSTDLNGDLRDTDGGFNCGKPAGWIEDYKSLPDDMKNLLKSIKRVRVLFGTVNFPIALNAKGEEIEGLTAVPFIWEVDNKDAFKEMGAPIAQMAKQKRILPQHNILLNTIEHSLPTGAVFFTPSAALDLSHTLPLTDEDQGTFASFNEWIDGYNDYVVKAFNEAMKEKAESEFDSVVEEFVDVEIQEAA